jgi:predicted metal-dependent peptidase
LDKSLVKYGKDALPRVAEACAIDKSSRDVRYSIKTAAKTAVLTEFDHMSFQRQNWFLGIIEASAEVTSPQLISTGRTESNKVGTGIENISPNLLDTISQN